MWSMFLKWSPRMIQKVLVKGQAFGLSVKLSVEAQPLSIRLPEINSSSVPSYSFLIVNTQGAA